MSKIINLTPHGIRVLNMNGSLAVELPPSGQVARVSVTREPSGNGPITLKDGRRIPVYRHETGAVTGLPAAEFSPVDGTTFFLVSLAVRLAVPERRDVLSPGEYVVRMESIGITALGRIAGWTDEGAEQTAPSGPRGRRSVNQRPARGRKAK